MKNSNLKFKANIQELGEKEMKRVNGGFLFLIVAALQLGVMFGLDYLIDGEWGA